MSQHEQLSLPWHNFQPPFPPCPLSPGSVGFLSSTLPAHPAPGHARDPCTENPSSVESHYGVFVGKRSRLRHTASV